MCVKCLCGMSSNQYEYDLDSYENMHNLQQFSFLFDTLSLK
jgi:hypothetical protein